MLKHVYNKAFSTRARSAHLARSSLPTLCSFNVTRRLYKLIHFKAIIQILPPDTIQHYSLWLLMLPDYHSQSD